MESSGRLRSLSDGFRPVKIVLLTILTLGAVGIGYVTALYGLVAGLAVAAIPCALSAVLFTVKSPVYAFFGLFVLNYFIMGIGRYAYDTLPAGTLLDALITYNVLVLLLHSTFHKVRWRRAGTFLTLMAGLWMLYGILQAVNPETVSFSGWFSSVRGIAFHFFFIVVIAQIVFDDYRYLRYILYVWSVLTLLAVAKALVQKYIGFDNAELYWLFVLGRHTTHIIHSGVRYFSFFSDAASFGAEMGLSMVVFSISALYVRRKRLKIYFLLVAAAALYGLLISGTRSALAIPFVGYVLYILMSKNLKIIALGAVAVIGAFIFLNYTHIGQGNALIRRARSAFDTSDPSLVVRLENQKKLRELMRGKPFGAGIGHGGGKAKTFAPDAPISQIPTDSWFVMIWVETGIVGLLLHLAILFAVLGRGMWLVMFRLRNPQLRGFVAALTAGAGGLAAMSYANEVLGQIPQGVLLYVSLAFIYLSPVYDRQLSARSQTTDAP